MNLSQEILKDCDAFYAYLLNNNISNEVVKKLKDEEITPRSFIDLTEDDLRRLNIKTGPRKELLRLVAAVNSTNGIVRKPSLIVVLSSHANIQVENTSVSSIADILNVEKNYLDEVNDVIFQKGNSDMAELLTAIPHTDRTVSDNLKEAPTVIDVRGWVKKRDEKNVKEPLLSILDSGVVKATHRQELVRLTVSEMSQLYNTLYPTAQIKEELAKNIILAFPKLRSMLTTGGYEHFYDRKTNTGFIEFRLKTLRLKLPSKDKKRAASVQLQNKKKLIKSIENESLLDEENFKLKVSELALKMPNDTNKELILKLIDETRTNRQNEIKNLHKSMTVTAILKKYPRLKDFNGELISREFSAVFPENDIFLETFCTFYAPRILQFCRKVKSDLLELVKDLEDNNLKALILLSELLPSPNYTKRKTPDKTKSSSKTSLKTKIGIDFSQKVVPNQNLLQFIHASDDLSLHIAPANRGTRNIQPYLLCFKRGQEKIGIYYIIADGHLIQIGDNAIIAFDILIKLHCCFNVEFASDLVNFYDFITGCVMKLHTPKGCSIALETTLQNVTLNENDESDDDLEIKIEVEDEKLIIK